MKRSRSQFIDLNAYFVEAYNNKGVSLSKLGRYADALEAYDKALALGLDYNEEAEEYYNQYNHFMFSISDNVNQNKENVIDCIGDMPPSS